MPLLPNCKYCLFLVYFLTVGIMFFHRSCKATWWSVQATSCGNGFLFSGYQCSIIWIYLACSNSDFCLFEVNMLTLTVIILLLCCTHSPVFAFCLHQILFLSIFPYCMHLLSAVLSVMLSVLSSNILYKLMLTTDWHQKF